MVWGKVMNKMVKKDRWEQKRVKDNPQNMIHDWRSSG
jgi:hypothetical protein